MKINIIENIKGEVDITIKCEKIDDDIISLKNHIQMYDDKKIYAKKRGEYYFVSSSDAMYFESVDNRTFIYTENDVMEIKYRLYELEEILSNKDFIRISKSQIVNINKISSLAPQVNRTLIAKMCNGEILCISRRFIKPIKNLLSI